MYRNVRDEGAKWGDIIEKWMSANNNRLEFLKWPEHVSDTTAADAQKNKKSEVAASYAPWFFDDYSKIHLVGNYDFLGRRQGKHITVLGTDVFCSIAEYKDDKQHGPTLSLKQNTRTVVRFYLDGTEEGPRVTTFGDGTEEIEYFKDGSTVEKSECLWKWT